MLVRYYVKDSLQIRNSLLPDLRYKILAIPLVSISTMGCTDLIKWSSAMKSRCFDVIVPKYVGRFFTC
jgi:hypothetical protein